MARTARSCPSRSSPSTSSTTSVSGSYVFAACAVVRVRCGKTYRGLAIDWWWLGRWIKRASCTDSPPTAYTRTTPRPALTSTSWPTSCHSLRPRPCLHQGLSAVGDDEKEHERRIVYFSPLFLLVCQESLADFRKNEGGVSSEFCRAESWACWCAGTRCLAVVRPHHTSHDAHAHDTQRTKSWSEGGKLGSSVVRSAYRAGGPGRASTKRTGPSGDATTERSSSRPTR